MRRQYRPEPSILVVLLLLWGAHGARADYQESFRKGIRAGDLKKWEEAAKWMQEAIAENSQESQQRIALSGVFSTRYLPHFYRGWYLFQKDRESHCEEALAEWEVSEQHGAVQKFKDQYADLEKGRGICQSLVLSPAISAARAQLDTARRRLAEAEGSQAQSPVADPTLEKRLQTIRQEFDAASALLNAGSDESRLSSVRQAESQARALADSLQQISGQIERQAADQIRTAAEQAKNAEALLDEDAEETPTREVSPPPEPQPPQVAASSPSEVAPSPPPPSAEPTQAISALVQEIRRLGEAAEHFLELISTENSQSELFKLQNSRIGLLVHEAQNQNPKATAAALVDLAGRLSDSLSALQLVAGAQAYFAGNPGNAIEILTFSELELGKPLAAQGHLFRAASHFALHLIGGVEADLSQAIAEAQKSSELDPGLTPDSVAFSPRFRKFFAENTQRR